MHEQRPILIHQMGKVGSRSVVESIAATLPETRIEHLHQLSREGLEAVAELSRSRGEEVPQHIAAAERVTREIFDRGVPANVITMVREPVGRNLSAFFQNLPAKDKRKKADDEAIEAMCAKFLEWYPHTMPISWFQREFDPVYGIEMLAEPFDPAVGWATYERGINRILLMRCELDDTIKAEAIRDFLGLDTLEWIRANESKNKAYGEKYARFKQRLVIPAELIDQLLDADYTRHFYTAEEIAGFRAKWSAAPTVSG